MVHIKISVASQAGQPRVDDMRQGMRKGVLMGKIPHEGGVRGTGSGRVANSRNQGTEGI